MLELNNGIIPTKNLIGVFKEQDDTNKSVMVLLYKSSKGPVEVRIRYNNYWKTHEEDYFAIKNFLKDQMTK